MPADPTRLRALAQEILKAEEMLTEGPWRAGIDGNDRMYGPDATESAGPIMIRAGNKHGIVALRNALPEVAESLPDLLDRVERYEAALRRILNVGPRTYEGKIALAALNPSEEGKRG